MAGVAQAYQHLLTIDRACRRVQCRVIQWSGDSFHCSNSTVLHSMIQKVDLPYNTRD